MTHFSLRKRRLKWSLNYKLALDSAADSNLFSPHINRRRTEKQEQIRCWNWIKKNASNTLTLLLNFNHLFHSYQSDTLFVFEAIKHFCEEVCTILNARDMQGEIVFNWMRSWTKCQWMSICFDLLWKMGLSDRATMPMLSEKMWIGLLRGIRSSWKICLIHAASWQAMPNA